MAVFLKNEHVEIEIDLPDANYRFSRFDWSGKIVNAWYKGYSFAGSESLDRANDHFMGRGFYNEFGIDSPLGFDDTAIGSWCHKIGVGLLKKNAPDYDFLKQHEIRPVSYTIKKEKDRLILSTQGALEQGFAYKLEKIIRLTEQGFEIQYELKNTGDKHIRTSEYNHNFLSIEKSMVSADYCVQFSFDIDQGRFDEFVNPENKLIINKQQVSFKSTPLKEFFIANISGGHSVNAFWSLEHRSLGLGLEERANFKTNAINLWGTKHVISPELFIKIDLAPGTTQRWNRSYRFYELVS